jgi:hypothetical protein
MLLVKNEILVMTPGLVRQIMRSVQQRHNTSFVIATNHILPLFTAYQPAVAAAWNVCLAALHRSANGDGIGNAQLYVHLSFPYFLSLYLEKGGIYHAETIINSDIPASILVSVLRTSLILALILPGHSAGVVAHCTTTLKMSSPTTVPERTKGREGVLREPPTNTPKRFPFLSSIDPGSCWLNELTTP